MNRATATHIFDLASRPRGNPGPGLLGQRGASLGRMALHGLPVPPGFVITTSFCAAYHENCRLSGGMVDSINAAVRRLERTTGLRLGDPWRPLLLAVRCDASVAMPGLMRTVLNVGANDRVAVGLERMTGDSRFAYDCYARLIANFGQVVADMPAERFQRELDELKAARPAGRQAEPDGDELQAICARYRCVYQDYVGTAFPQHPVTQLFMCIKAALRSWNSASAVAYRRMHGLEDLPGLAITVQAMVFGNLGDDSATGTVFTRHPITGQNRPHGEFFINAQGRPADREPLPIEKMKRLLPRGWRALGRIQRILEKTHRDAQEFQFVIQQGTLFLLQSRSANRGPEAAVRIAVEMAREKVIDAKAAVLQVDPATLEQLLHPTFDAKAPRKLLASGLPASPGAAAGKIAFSAAEAQQRIAEGESIILVRRETDAADVAAMHRCQAVLTSSGGMTSHAAVVARGIGTPCVAGASSLLIDEARRTVAVAGRTFTANDFLSLDGASGEVYEGEVPIVDAEPGGHLRTLLSWADRYRTLRIRANADTPDDALLARALGAEGIGLCRTEHMFFSSPQRLSAMRQMILAEELAGREAALAKLLPYQRQDFIAIFEAMERLPVTIRLLDPPLHEFLPRNPKDQDDLARAMNLSPAQVRHRIEQLRESNPMLGHRGCRLCVTYPEILNMQVRAILEAACACRKRGLRPRIEIMFPLVMSAEELRLLNKIARATAEQVLAEQGVKLPYALGTMIETPRAALLADQLAGETEFFSFGTNDLTQMTLGMSRDDASGFLPTYLRRRILGHDPFAAIDESGVGLLVQTAVARGRAARPNLKCGVCGEHGGDPASIAFFHRAGLDYVSCSPFRVPIARLAAAQAALRITSSASPVSPRQAAARPCDRAAPAPFPSGTRSCRPRRGGDG
jgi:pyruvate,orthophosphate dikinase